jgi:D-glycero-D-manno-heptose 1,7-bisphosphate phosphatase
MNDRSVQPLAAEDDVGLWRGIGAGDFAGKPALFIDRDGVLIEDSGYLGRAEDLRMLADAAAGVAHCNRAGIPVILVTNQSGIARGLYGWADFHAVQAALAEALKRADAHFDAAFACAYHPDGRPPLNVAAHPWRKPNPGMFVAAGEAMRLDLARSWVIGDRASDLAAGRAAGLAGGILLPGAADAGEHAAAQALGTKRFAVAHAPSLMEAVSLLVARQALTRRS